MYHAPLYHWLQGQIISQPISASSASQQRAQSIRHSRDIIAGLAASVFLPKVDFEAMKCGCVKIEFNTL